MNRKFDLDQALLMTWFVFFGDCMLSAFFFFAMSYLKNRNQCFDLVLAESLFWIKLYLMSCL